MINILQHLDVWTSAVETRSTAGRGSSNKLNLYGIKKLRELILELAVRGQLVPQNPDDEPASVLLEKIAAEKARLIKEGKLKKQEPLPPITDDEKPFELPEGWEWVRLGAICNFVNGYAFKSSDFSDVGIGIVKIGDIQNGAISTGSMSFVPDSIVSKLDDSFQVKPGDMLIAMSGATTGKLGFNLTKNIFYLNQRVGKIVPIRVNVHYLYFPLTTKIAENLSKSMGSAIPNLSTTQIREIVFALPPESEQHRIVAKVNELMSLCDALEQEQAANIAAHQTLVEELLAALTSSPPNSPPSLTLPPQGVEGTRDKNRDALLLPSPLAGEGLGMGGMPAWARIATHFDTLFTTEHSIDQLKQTILQLAVMGKLVPQDPNDEPASRLLQKIAAEKARLIKAGKIKKEKPLPAITDDEKPFELPNGWEWVKLGAVLDIASGVTLGRKDIGNDRMELPYLRVANVQRGYLLLDDVKTVEIKKDELSRYQLLKDDLLVTEGGDWDKVGRTAIWNAQIIQCLHQNHILRMRKFTDDMSSSWIQMYMNSAAKAYFQAASKQTTNLASINMTQLKNCPFSIPPLAEQHRIVAKVDELMALCDAMKAQISAAQATQLQLADVLAGQII